MKQPKSLNTNNKNDKRAAMLKPHTHRFDLHPQVFGTIEGNTFPLPPAFSRFLH